MPLIAVLSSMELMFVYFHKTLSRDYTSKLSEFESNVYRLAGTDEFNLN